MNRPVQKRTLATRAKLIAAAKTAIDAKGFAAMRVEEVVQEAGVAKGTFFAHFSDKDALMDLIIADYINHILDEIEQRAVPESVDTLICGLDPLLSFMTSERYVFDLILRHSGAAAKEEIGPISQTFTRMHILFSHWLATQSFRKDVPPAILAEGIQAFAIQAIALDFCAANNEMPMQVRLRIYLEAWLRPSCI